MTIEDLRGRSEQAPNTRHVTFLRPDLVGGIQSALQFLQRHGLGSYNIQTEPADNGRTRVEIIGEPGRMDPALEIVSILENEGTVRSDLPSIRERISTRLAEMVETARHPRVQRAIAQTRASLTQLRSGN